MKCAFFNFNITKDYYIFFDEFFLLTSIPSETFLLPYANIYNLYNHLIKFKDNI